MKTHYIISLIIAVTPQHWHLVLALKRPLVHYSDHIVHYSAYCIICITVHNMHCSGEDALQFTMCTAVIKMHFLNGFYHAVHRLALRASQCRLLALPSTAVQDGCIIVSMFFWDEQYIGKICEKVCVCVICATRCTCQQIDTNPGLDQPRKGRERCPYTSIRGLINPGRERCPYANIRGLINPGRERCP